jgi:thioredoxin 1
MTNRIEHIDDLNFEGAVLQSEEPYLLDFSATWCAPCRALEPILEALASEQAGRLRVGKVDIDVSPDVAARFGVRGAPTLILFRDGKEAARRLGRTSKATLLALIGAAAPRSGSAPARMTHDQA